MSNDENKQEQYPGVESAQAYILPSYEWMLTRIESADSRIQTLVAFVATTTLAVPTIGVSLRDGISLGSGWFLAALGAAIVVILVGIITRSTGSLTLPSPQRFYDEWLHLSPWEFQKDALYFAGEHFAANAALVKRKAMVLTVMTFLFVVELAFLAVWIFTAGSGGPS